MCFAFLVSWHIDFRGLFNAKAIFIEGYKRHTYLEEKKLFITLSRVLI